MKRQSFRRRMGFALSGIASALRSEPSFRFQLAAAAGALGLLAWLKASAAWWALVIDRPTMLRQLATSLPMMAAGALERCCEQADALRTAVSSAESTRTTSRPMTSLIVRARNG